MKNNKLIISNDFNRLLIKLARILANVHDQSLSLHHPLIIISAAVLFIYLLVYLFIFIYLHCIFLRNKLMYTVFITGPPTHSAGGSRLLFCSPCVCRRRLSTVVVSCRRL